MMPSLRPTAARLLRGLVRRLPTSRAYERRIAELDAELQRQLQRRHELHHQLQQQPVLWVPPGHFYSPLVDVSDPAVAAALAIDRTAEPAGVDLRLEAQWDLYEALRPSLTGIRHARTPQEAAERGVRYFSDNPAYGDGDAAVLEAMLRRLRPRRVVELGCGYSSACMLDVREQQLGAGTSFTFVDPYPQLLDSLVRPGDAAAVSVLSVGTQQVDLARFADLAPGDVLFIDSTHVAKTGSDVTRIFNEILPAVGPGVFIHLHDHFAGFEYPDPWVAEGRSWNEQYVTRAFLQFNECFEILLWPSLLAMIDPDRFGRDVPPRANGGGALWLRRVR